MSPPVVVIGASLAGMAAAARLAKAGHPVELIERTGRLGGRWAPYALEGTELLVDDAPCVLGFPAPWRDLFRKSGRPFEAELARTGHVLAPAGPEHVIFADGTRLTWPTDRGEQYAALTDTWGPAVAGRWRDLVDRLDDVRQTLRPLGQELELNPDRLTRPVREQLLHRRTVADLARSLDHPQLAALVRSLAYQRGSVPERTPALAATDLSVARKFGRWQLQRVDPADQRDLGRSSVLVDALSARLSVRKVTVRLDTTVTGLTVDAGRVTGVVTATGLTPAAAVISTVDPWHLHQTLLPRTGRRLRRVRRWQPAGAPRVSHTLLDEPATGLAQTTRLSSTGVPVISYDRPADGQTLRSVHDFRDPQPDRSHGLADRGFGAWADRPPISGPLGALYLAGPFTAAGPAASTTVLAGALASYAVHDQLGDPG